MENLALPVLFAALIEAVVYYVDRLVVQKIWDWRLIASLAIGIVAAAAFGQDWFADAGYVAAVPLIGSIFTGILFGRAANFVHGIGTKLAANAN
jgi:hypothetical protein